MGIFLGILPLNLKGFDFAIQDLGTLTTNESIVSGINNQNTIVGYSKQADYANDFMWKANNGLTFLPYTTYQSPYQSPCINNLNQVVSIFWHRTNHWFANNTRSKHIYIYDNGQLQVIAPPKHWKSERLEDWQNSSYSFYNQDLGILAFNNNQQILIANAPVSHKATRFAIWQNATFTEIDSNIINDAYGMNNEGVILGRKWIQKENINIPMLVLYNPKDGTIVEITKDVNIINRKLNDQGQVIIFQALKNPVGFKGSLWDPERGLIELENFGPIALNNCNQIIGLKISEFQNNKIVPLMWTPSEVIPLTQFIESNDLESIWSEITSIDGINDNGYIIGHGLFDGKKHAFVLVPQ